MRQNYLKKVQIGNPLYNLGMHQELKKYEKAQTDEELAAIYHELLDKAEKMNSTVLLNFTYAMISFSTNMSINPLMFLL